MLLVILVDIPSAHEGSIFQRRMLLAVLKSGFSADGPRLKPQSAAAAGPRGPRGSKKNNAQIYGFVDHIN